MERPFSKIKLLRIWNKNDPLVSIEDIHLNLRKFATKVVLTESGGHCAVNREKQLVEEIRAWNKEAVVNWH